MSACFATSVRCAKGGETTRGEFEPGRGAEGNCEKICFVLSPATITCDNATYQQRGPHLQLALCGWGLSAARSCLANLLTRSDIWPHLVGGSSDGLSLRLFVFRHQLFFFAALRAHLNPAIISGRDLRQEVAISVCIKDESGWMLSQPY